jgi:hypothetical protein
MDCLIRHFMIKEPFSKTVFAAHSESDTTANIMGIEELQQVSIAEKFTFFRIPKSFGVSHASLVLKEPVYAIDPNQPHELLEQANPLFQQMLDAIAAME